jgi:hypothetical protein
MYQGFITTLKNVRPHSNADRLQLGDCFGNTICIDLSFTEGQTVLYLPIDGQVSLEFALQNNLLRKLPDGTPSTGYLDPDKRNITAIKLRGERSEGLVLPLESLSYAGDISTLHVGDPITVFNGHEICRKYIPRTNPSRSQSGGNSKGKVRKEAKEQTPYFAEHIDTPQLRFTMGNFKPGDIICLTEKVHGTSSRNANTLTISHKKNFFDKVFNRPGKEIQEYKYIVGTRRTTVNGTKGGFYGDNQFRIDWGEKFKGKLLQGEEVFGEIAGFTNSGAPIMGVCENSKIKDKEFSKTYGKTTCFSYGCESPESRYFVYRMTYTTPDGYVIEYPWDLVKLRAEQMGFETVPELDRFIYTTEEDFMTRIQKWLDIPSTIDSRHIIEGVVVRALNATGFRVAKEKSWAFKVLEGIMKDEAAVPDMEEAEEVLIEL